MKKRAIVGAIGAALVGFGLSIIGLPMLIVLPVAGAAAGVLSGALKD